MKPNSCLFRSLLVGWLCVTAGQLAVAAENEGGFKPLFNGTDLTGWEGLPQFWSVQDGALTGQTTAQNPTKGNTFLVWKGGDVQDFELRLSYKIVANNGKGFGNSGIQYRSKIADQANFVVGGYQGDFEAGKTYSGILYEERGRGILAERGQRVVVKPDPANPDKTKIEVLGTLGSSDAIQGKIKANDWNEYVIIARGNHLQHFINGQQTIDVTDEQPAKAAKSGVLALQLHAGDPMTVQFKNVQLKTLSGVASARTDAEELQGQWQPAEIIDKGEKRSADVLAEIRLKIKGSAFTLRHSEGQYEGAFKLDSASSPKHMDVTLDDGTEVAAIYELTDGRFRVCYGEPGTSRPTTFASRDGSDQILVTYNRKQ